MNSVVIVGSGLAGASVARELRKIDSAVSIVIVASDDGDFYSKPNLSNALAAGKAPAQLVATPRAVFAEQQRIEIRAHTRVDAILPGEHALQTSAGRIAYSRLVLAVGAQPIRLPIEGNGAGDVLAVNNMADYTVFRQRLAGKRRVAILGAGLIGCEFANDLAGAAYAVDVFDLAPQPLGRLLPAAAADHFRRQLEAAGVRFHFGTSIGRVDRTDDGLILLDLKGNEFAADLVLSAVGLRPETALARAAGLATNRGITVDSRLATSDADIFAVGDCAEVQGLVLPFVLPIMQQARALAKTLAGTPTAVAYPAMPVVVKTPACPTVVCPPPAGNAGAWREDASAAGVRAVFEDATGAAIGFALLGDAMKEKQALAAHMPPWL
ncbi:MAG: FAD-dependent oxidoreductase [Rhodocyclaceae bacterium]|nr:FAD-dependent oxidoreductase [Rhodocyclaceae bacterium]